VEDFIWREFVRKDGFVFRLRHFKAACSNCGADRGYQLTAYLIGLCGSCSKTGKRNSMYGKPSAFTEYNKAQAGKAYEERYGEEQSEAIKAKLSITSSGKNNGMYGKPSAFVEYNKAQKGKTSVERLGLEKAEAQRKKKSKAATGKNNPMYGKPAPLGSGNGWKGHYKEVYFRSMLELRYLYFFDINNIEFENAEQRKFTVKYEINGVDRTYRADFYLPEYDYIIEVKPLKLHNTPTNAAKHQAAEMQFNNFTVVDEYAIPIVPTDILLSCDIMWDKKYKERVVNYLEGKNNDN